MKKIFKEMFAKAEEHLESAEILFKAGNYGDSISRAYYGMLEAATTILVNEKIYPKSHSGAIYKFNQHYIKSGRVAKKFGAFLSRAEKLRIDADYNYRARFTKEKAETILAQASEFVTEAKKLLS